MVSDLFFYKESNVFFWEGRGGVKGVVWRE